MAEHTPLAALDLTGRISTAGCSVNDATPALIKLPAAMLDHFGGVGKTTGDTPFALQLDCNSAVTISLRVDGAEPSPPGGMAFCAMTPPTIGRRVSACNCFTIASRSP